MYRLRVCGKLLLPQPAKPSKPKGVIMPREKGSKNKATLAREAQERARIIAEYEANRKAESPPDPPPPAKEVAKTIEEHEELDLGPTGDDTDPSDAAVASAPAVSTGEPVAESAAIETTEDDPLDLEPPVNPIRAKKEQSKVRQEQPKPKSLDKRQPASVPSRKPVKPIGFTQQRKATPSPASRPATWRLGSRGS